MSTRLARNSVLPAVGLIALALWIIIAARSGPITLSATASSGTSNAVSTAFFSTFPVVNNLDSGVGSLRQAIMDANGTAGADLIRFDIPGSGVHTISLMSPLPEITEAVTIDGTTQPSGTIALDGSGAGAGATGLVIHSGNSVVRGLAINGFNANGITLDTNGGNLIEGNQIANGAAGIFVKSS